MAANSNPKGHIWSSDAFCDIITTKTKMFDCRARGGFHAVIHRDLLCHFSTYYTALLKGGFAEAGTDNVTFELDRPQARMLITWLYSGSITEDARYHDIFDLYLFADMTDIRALRKSIMDHLHKHSHEKGNPRLKHVAKVLAVLSKSSGLVRWMVDRYARHWRVRISDEPKRKRAMEKYKDFFIQVRAAQGKAKVYTCRSSQCCVIEDPCCDTVDDTRGCGCSHHTNTPSQACNYHEHANFDEWRNCAGKKWCYSHIADAAYLRGTTADDPLPKDRLATYEYDSSDDEGGFGSSPRKIWKFRNYLPEDDERLVMMSLR
ncbi:hypothetical protein D6C82_06565 [Aureobasidium pullulans]|nr:hypothetical protein D6C82_06565 [Aureobasidium pullulans]